MAKCTVSPHAPKKVTPLKEATILNALKGCGIFWGKSWHPLTCEINQLAESITCEPGLCSEPAEWGKGGKHSVQRHVKGDLHLRTFNLKKRRNKCQLTRERSSGYWRCCHGSVWGASQRSSLDPTNASFFQCTVETTQFLLLRTEEPLRSLPLMKRITATT